MSTVTEAVKDMETHKNIDEKKETIEYYQARMALTKKRKKQTAREMSLESLHNLDYLAGIVQEQAKKLDQQNEIITMFAIAFDLLIENKIITKEQISEKAANLKQIVGSEESSDDGDEEEAIPRGEGSSVSPEVDVR